MNPLTDFDHWARELRSGRLEQHIQYVRDYYSSLSGTAAANYRPWALFLSRKAHLLRRGDERWPAYKILLQLATQMPSQHPVRIATEEWLKQDNCDWRWLRNVTADTGHAEPDETDAVVMEHDYPDSPQFSGTVGVYGATVLRDGTIASWGGTGTVRLWTAQGEPIQTLRGHHYSIHGLIEEESGTLLAWSRVNRVIRWNRDGGIQRTYVVSDIPQEPACLNAVLAAPEGRFVTYTSCKKGSRLSLWGDGETPIASSLAPPDPHYTGSHCFNPDFVSWANQTLTQWGVPSHLCGVLDRAMSDDRYGMLAWSDTIVRVYASDGSFRLELSGHSDEVLGGVFTPSGKIVTWGADAAVLVWSEDGTLLRRLTDHDDMVVHVLVDADETIWSWDFGGRLIRWGASGAVLGSSQEFTACVEGAKTLSDGSVVAWSIRGELFRYTASGTAVREFSGHTDRITGVLERDDGALLSWSVDGTVRLWFLVSQNRRNDDTTMRSGSNPPKCVSISVEAGTLLCTYSDKDPNLRLWSVTGELQARIDTATDGVRAVWPVATEASPVLVWWSRDGRVGISGTDSLRSSPIEVDGEEITAATVGMNGEILVGMENGAVAVCAADGSTKRRMPGHSERVTACHWIAPGMYITSSRDRTIRIWTGSESDTIQMPIRDFKHLVRNDGAVFAWSNRGIAVYQPDQRTVTHTETNEYFYTATWLEDGTIVSITLGGEIFLWNADGTLRKRYRPYPDCEAPDLYLEICYESTFLTAYPTAKKVDRWGSDGSHIESVPFNRFEIAALSCSDRYDRSCVAFTGRDGTKLESLWASGNHFCRMIIDKKEEVRYHTEGDATAWDVLHDGTAVLTDSIAGLTLVRMYEGKQPVSVR